MLSPSKAELKVKVAVKNPFACGFYCFLNTVDFAWNKEVRINNIYPLYI